MIRASFPLTSNLIHPFKTSSSGSNSSFRYRSPSVPLTWLLYFCPPVTQATIATHRLLLHYSSDSSGRFVAPSQRTWVRPSLPLSITLPHSSLPQFPLAPLTGFGQWAWAAAGAVTAGRQTKSGKSSSTRPDRSVTWRSRTTRCDLAAIRSTGCAAPEVPFRRSDNLTSTLELALVGEGHVTFFVVNWKQSSKMLRVEVRRAKDREWSTSSSRFNGNARRFEQSSRF